MGDFGSILNPFNILGTDPKVPDDRKYDKETLSTFRTQRKLAPLVFAAEEKWQPKYAQLAQKNLGISLLGDGATPGVMQMNERALREADPATYQLLDRVTAEAGRDMDLGTAMDPATFRMVTQGLRGRQQGMLSGTGTAGDFQEAMGISAYGRELRERRIGSAKDVASLRQRFSSNVAPTSLAMGISGGARPRLFNPESSYAGDIYNTNFNAEAAANIAAANNNAALMSSLMSAVGGASGSI